MFRLPKKTFWWTVRVPVAQDGKHVKVPLKLEFKRLSMDELKASARLGDSEFLHEIVADWAQIEGPDGAEFPCTHENKDTLFSDPAISVAIAKQYREAITGEVGGPLGI